MIDAETMREEARRSGFSEIADELAALARPAFHLVAATGGGPVVGRLGGLPRLPPEVAWPQTRWTTVPAEPLTFLGELDLSALDPSIWPGPTEGSLSFFCAIDDEAFYVDSGGAALVLHHPAGKDRVPVDVPSELHEDLWLAEVDVEARPVVTLPWVGVGPAQQLIPFGIDALGDLERAKRYLQMLRRLTGERAKHRLLGWPRFTQDDVAYHWPTLQDEAVDHGLSSGDVPDDGWQLLLQVGSDEKLGTGFGDGGEQFFSIPSADLRAGRFDRVQAISDSG